MSKLKVIKLLLVITSLNAMAEPSEDYGTVSEKTVIAAIGGDMSAKSMLLKKDKSKILNRLQRIVVSRDFDASTTNAALEMIKTTPNSVNHFRDQIINDKSGSSDPSAYQAFEILAKLKTEESIKTVAQFLFDTSNPTDKGSEDVGTPSPNRWIAVSVLSELQIEGAPTGKVNSDTIETRLQEWKAWWKQKHSVK